MTWGKRYCLNCGKEFEAAYIQQIYCNEECKNECKKNRDNDYRKAYQAKLKKAYKEHKLCPVEKENMRKRIDELECEISLLRKKNDELTDELSKRDEELCDAKEKLGVLEKKTLAGTKEKAPGIPEMKLKECTRLRLKCTGPLPCGKQIGCFKPTRCEFLSADASINRLDLNARWSRSDQNEDYL